MDQQEREVYHAWLRQQLRVQDIAPDDFRESELYFVSKIRWALERPTEETRTAQQAYINAVATQVAADMDGTRINAHRQLTGKTYRSAETPRYVESLPEHQDPPIRFVYHPYTGAMTIAEDWTIGYDGINPMGSFSHHFSEESRQAELHDDDGTRWPESEIYPVEYPDALYHLLRMKQFRPDRPGWNTSCGVEACDQAGRCSHDDQADRILDEEYRRFREARQTGAQTRFQDRPAKSR